MFISPFLKTYKRQKRREFPQPPPGTPVHRLSQNENPFGPSPKEIEAIQQTAPQLAYYPEFSDLPLREAIATTFEGVTADMIYTGCSGYEALEMLTRGTLMPGDECIVTSPTFTSAYNKMAGLQGATVRDVPLLPDTFAFDVDGVLAAITERTRLIFLCNPNNPTGTIITQAEMDRLMTSLPAHVLVVADEVYHHFVDRDDFPDSLRYVHGGKNIVIVHSFSKAYGLAGLRLGYGIARPEIADSLGAMHRGFHNNALNFVAGVAACADQAYLRECVQKLNAEKAWMMAQLESLPGVRYWPSQTNFLLVQTALTSAALTQELALKGLQVREQRSPVLSHAVRISMGTHEANTQLIDAMRDILC